MRSSSEDQCDDARRSTAVYSSRRFSGTYDAAFSPGADEIRVTFCGDVEDADEDEDDDDAVDEEPPADLVRFSGVAMLRGRR